MKKIIHSFLQTEKIVQAGYFFFPNKVMSFNEGIIIHSIALSFGGNICAIF